LFSFLLMFIAYYIRVHFQESPIFEEIKAKGAMTKNPWKEAFLSANIKFVLIATIIVLGGRRGLVQRPVLGAPLPAAGHQGGRADHPLEQPGGERMPASVHFLSADATAAMPDSRHKLRNAGRVFATNRETRNLCGEIRLKQACGRC
jgi:hypothetical protein